MWITKHRGHANLCRAKTVLVLKGVFSTGDISHPLSLADGKAEERD